MEEIVSIDAEVKHFNERRKTLKETVTNLMEEAGLKKFSVDGIGSVTISYPEKLVLDTDRLLEIGDKDVIDRVTVYTIDKDLLEEAIKDGTISAELVDEITSYEKMSPRLTVKAAR